jgi:tetratricopeptide (TPR) repeat protein
VTRLAELAHGLYGLGHAQESRGALADAVAALQESSAIGARLLVREPQNVMAAYYRGAALSSACEMEIDLRGGESALPDCQASRVTLESLSARMPDDVKIIAALGRALRGTGMAYLLTARPREARGPLEAALALFQKAAAKSPDSDIQRSDLSGGHRDIGRVFLRLGQLDAARSALTQAVALDDQQLATHPDATRFEAHVGEILLFLGMTERRAGRLPDARAAYARALAHFERTLAVFPDDVSWQVDLAQACLRIAAVETDPARRAALQQRAHDVTTPLEAKLSPQNREDLADASR